MAGKDETWRQKIHFQLSPPFVVRSTLSRRATENWSLTGARRDLVKNAVLSIFTWTDRNDEVRQSSEIARIRGDKTTKPFKRKATKTRNIAHWSAMDVSVSDKGTAWIIRAWPDTRIWCNYCLWCGCCMRKLFLHITGKFACAAFRRKVKGTLARFIPGEIWNCTGNFRLHRAKMWTVKGLSEGFRNVFRL